MSGLAGLARRLGGRRSPEPAGAAATPPPLGYDASPFVPPPVVAVEALTDRVPATVEVTLVAARVEPDVASPRFVAVGDDGTGTVHLVWLGRHSLRGVRAGVRLRAHGLVAGLGAGHGAVPVIHNPRYEIVPPAPEDTP